MQLPIQRLLRLEEVAKLLGKSMGAVYAARSRIMRRLREQVQRLQDSATGEITKGMELGPWSRTLREKGVNDPQMLNPEQVVPKF